MPQIIKMGFLKYNIFLMAYLSLVMRWAVILVMHFIHIVLDGILFKIICL